MNHANHAETQLAILVTLGMVGYFVFSMARRFLRSARTADPWDSEVGSALESADAREVCLHCLAEQPPGAWFCPRCGSSTGPYNAMMPYLNVFAQAEALRHGTEERRRFTAGQIAAYLALSVPIMGVFAPAYWCAFWINLRASRRITAAASPVPPGSNQT